MQAVSYPLAGLKVLDFSRVVAGPFATRMMADLGADVVKVEPPDGDLLRTWGGNQDGLSSYFNQENAGKRCISIDMKAPGATDLLLKLVGEADIVVENYRPGVMAKFGLDYESCKQVNESLLYLSISGYGQTSSWKDRPAYAPVIHAESGLLDRQAKLTGQPPTNPPLSIADTNAGLHGLVGLLAALFMRERTGTGQHLDISMMASMMVTDDYVHWALDGVPVRPLGGSVRSTGYGHIMISGDLRSTWFQLNSVGLVQDGLEPGASVADKIVAREAALDTWFAAFDDAAVLESKLDALNMPWGNVQETGAVFDSEIGQELGLAVTLDYPTGQRRVPQSPYRFSDAEAGVQGRAPYRGEHNLAVLDEWLGTSEDEVDGLVKSGALLADVPDLSAPDEHSTH